MAKRKATDHVQLKVRLREDLRARLERAASKNHESLNREIVERLERSFVRPDHIEALTLQYGERLAGILLVAGRAMEEAGRLGAFASDPEAGGEAWHGIPYAYREAANAAMTVIAAYKPKKGPPGPDPGFVKAFKIDDIGLRAATRLLDAIDGNAPPDLRSWASTMRRLVKNPAEGEAK